MRFIWIVVAGLILAAPAWAQGDRGTITGTISDPGGAVVASAPIEARHVETGAVFPAASSATGNYTLSQLPVGTYTLTVSVNGFKGYVRPNIQVQAAQTVRIDAVLEVGATTDSITVSEVSPLLKTESGELSHNISSDQIDDLPVLGIGAAGGDRGHSQSLLGDPVAAGQRTFWGRFEPADKRHAEQHAGAPDRWARTQRTVIPRRNRCRRQALTRSRSSRSRPAIIAAEFGQAGGGLFNVTMKSGSNQLHGSVYEYFVNEVPQCGDAEHERRATASTYGIASAETTTDSRSAGRWYYPKSLTAATSCSSFSASNSFAKRRLTRRRAIRCRLRPITLAISRRH